MKILIISLAGIGDTLMATPLIHRLKEIFPESKIDVLVMWSGSKDILEKNPYINQIYQFNMIKEGFFKTLLFCEKLNKNKYDISINTYPQSRIHYRIISKLIGAKKRLSHKYENWNFLDNFLINKKINQDYSLHCVGNNLNLIKLISNEEIKKAGYEIFFSNEEIKKAEKFITDNSLKDKTLIGFHVGSSKTKNLEFRRWPTENYLELAKKIIKENENITILLFGGPEEEKDNKIIKENIREKVIIVKTANIKDTALIIKKCYIFLSVDTALMHLASAVNIKNQIVLETPTFNKTVYPYNNKFKTIKNPNIKKDKLNYYRYDGKGIKLNKQKIIEIMNGITVEKVYSKIKKIIN